MFTQEIKTALSEQIELDDSIVNDDNRWKGVIEAGYEVNNFYIGVGHESIVTTSRDDGKEYIMVGLRLRF